MKTAATSLLCVIALCLAGLNPVRAHAQTAPKAGAMAEHDHVAAPPSTSLTLTIDGKATTLSVDGIQAMPLGEDGQLKLVDSGDKKPQRWVRNLKSITVKSAE